MSFLSIFPWWIWLTGTLGFGGMLVLIIVAPAIAGAAEKGIAAVLRRILATRTGLGVIVLLIGLFFGHVEGALYLEHKCEARIEDLKVKSAAAGRARDAAVTRDTERQFTPVIADLDTLGDALKQKASDYERNQRADPANRTGDRCRLGAAALRLRNERR